MNDFKQSINELIDAITTQMGEVYAQTIATGGRALKAVIAEVKLQELQELQEHLDKAAAHAIEAASILAGVIERSSEDLSRVEEDYDEAVESAMMELEGQVDSIIGQAVQSAPAGLMQLASFDEAEAALEDFAPDEVGGAGVRDERARDIAESAIATGGGEDAALGRAVAQAHEAGLDSKEMKIMVEHFDSTFE